jgi:hypothetical protein
MGVKIDTKLNPSQPPIKNKEKCIEAIIK